MDVAKHKSLDAHGVWLDTGKPRSGPIFLEKFRANSEYKSLLRRSKAHSDRDISDSLATDLLSSNNQSFWRKWNNLRGPNVSPTTMIDGNINNRDIADHFSGFFQRIYTGSPANDLLQEKFKVEYENYCATHKHDSIIPFLFSWSDMVDAALKMKLSKASSTFFKSEHILYGCPELLYYLHLLFNGLLSHGYVPFEFLRGTICPIIKDSSGDCSDPNNYRGITLSPCLAQLLEYCLLGKFDSFLTCDDLQFGFKRGLSTSHAIFALKSCVDYYSKYHTNVFVTLLDCSKAFDKVSHYGIFLKLMSRGVPLCFLNLFIYWYLNLFCCCQWNGVKSEYFRVLTGTKQGGVISPSIFTLYLEELITRLRR